MGGTRKLNVVQVVSSSATSGAERHVLALSKHLHQSDHKVEVLSPEGGWLSGDLRDAGIPAHTTLMRGTGWFKTVGYLVRMLRHNRADVVHTHLTRATYFGVVAGMLTRTPVVATVHIANHDQVYKRMARGRNRLVAVSNYVRGMLHGRGIPDRFIDTVYNGTDFADFEYESPDAVKSEFGIPSERRLVGLVGRVCREKGHLLMIEAMKDIVKEHPQAHVLFVGRVTKENQPEIDDAISAAGLSERVTLTGNRHDVPRLLDAFEFSTMPSQIETFGLAAIEAMARGKAVVASRVGGLPEVVRHQQNGLLVDLRPQELAEAVDYLLRNTPESQRMGAAGRRIVEEKFTLHRMAKQLESVYERAAGISS